MQILIKSLGHFWKQVQHFNTLLINTDFFLIKSLNLNLLFEIFTNPLNIFQEILKDKQTIMAAACCVYNSTTEQQKRLDIKVDCNVGTLIRPRC